MITRKERFINLAIDLLAIAIGCGGIYLVLTTNRCVATGEPTLHCGDCHRHAVMLLGVSALITVPIMVWQEFFRKERNYW